MQDQEEQRRQLTFVVVGWPHGRRIGRSDRRDERFTLARDFRKINSKLARVIPIESGPRILPMFTEEQASRATRDLETRGVQVWTCRKVTSIDNGGVQVGPERLRSATVLWAAGVEASALGRQVSTEIDRQGRVIVERDVSLKGSLICNRCE